jgi:hypothetical protein
MPGIKIVKIVSVPISSLGKFPTTESEIVRFAGAGWPDMVLAGVGE